ncbi:Replicase polyprotein 1ab [Bienertia sinuspersici]
MLDLGKKCGEYSGSCDLYYVVPGLSMLEGLRKIVDDRVVLEMGELAKQYRSIDVYMDQSVDGMCLTPVAKTTPKDSENETQTEKAKKLTPKKAKKLTPKSGTHVLKTHVEHVTTRLTQKDSPSSSQQTKTLKEAPFSSPITTEVIIPPILQEPEPEPPLLQEPEPQPSTLQELEPEPLILQEPEPRPSTLQELEPEPDFITNYEWEDPRPESPINLKDLLGWSNSGSDSDDPLYEPGVDISDSEVEDRYGGDDENELEEEFEFDDEEEDVGDDDNLESENDDEEYATARQRVRTCNSRLVQVAQQLQREAAEGKLSAQQVFVKQHIAKDKDDGGEGYESEYYDSDHDLETPPSSGDEGEGDSGRGSRRGQLVGPETDFSTFSWKVRQRFPNRQDFKQAVARYGIMQARPHWPAKDIIETVRRAYKMVIRRDFAYKIKYHAHRLLHGSMQERYHKVGRHIFAHWHKAFRGDEMKLQFWKISKAYNMADYNDAIEELGNMNPAAVTAFKAYNPSCFYRAFMDTTIKCDAITNNMAETFNGYIINARTKHVIYMMEDIRVAVMQRLVSKRQEMEKQGTELCPRIQILLDKEKDKACYCDVLPSADQVFNVKHNLDQLNVDLQNRSCTCRKWDATGIPCCHAIACIYFQNKDAESFVDDLYKRACYLKAYAGSIPPCEGERHWPRVECKLNPPPIKIGPGRPRKNRIKDPYEKPKKPGVLSRHGMEMSCSICKAKGHNKRKCPNKDTAVANTQASTSNAPPAKKARGRPKKNVGPQLDAEVNLLEEGLGLDMVEGMGQEEEEEKEEEEQEIRNLVGLEYQL